MKIVILLGSLREGSYNRMLANHVIENYSQDFDFELLDVDLPIFNQDIENNPPEKVKYLNEKVNQADGVLIISPEYNHTIPGGTKNAIDWMSRDPRPLVKKPVLLFGASDGQVGTARSTKELRLTLQAPGVAARPMPAKELLVPYADEAFDEDGRLIIERTEKYIGKLLEEFKEFVKEINNS